MPSSSTKPTMMNVRTRLVGLAGARWAMAEGAAGLLVEYGRPAIALGQREAGIGVLRLLRRAPAGPSGRRGR